MCVSEILFWRGHYFYVHARKVYGLENRGDNREISFLVRGLRKVEGYHLAQRRSNVHAVCRWESVYCGSHLCSRRLTITSLQATDATSFRRLRLRTCLMQRLLCGKSRLAMNGSSMCWVGEGVRMCMLSVYKVWAWPWKYLGCSVLDSNVKLITSFGNRDIRISRIAIYVLCVNLHSSIARKWRFPSTTWLLLDFCMFMNLKANSIELRVRNLKVCRNIEAINTISCMDAKSVFACWISRKTTSSTWTAKI